MTRFTVDPARLQALQEQAAMQLGKTRSLQELRAKANEPVRDCRDAAVMAGAHRMRLQIDHRTPLAEIAAVNPPLVDPSVIEAAMKGEARVRELDARIATESAALNELSALVQACEEYHA